MKWSDFLPQVLPYTPGCPDLLAVDHIRSAAREFAAETGVWNYETQPVLTVAGSSIYQLDLDQSQERVRLMGHAFLDSCPIAVCDAKLGRARVRTKSWGHFVYLEGPYDFVLYPTPDVSGKEIVLQLSVKPSAASESWPDDLGEYINEIAQGAISSLCRLPKKEWSDRQQAIDARGAFEAAKGRVAFRVATGFTGRLAPIRHRLA